MKNRWSDSEAEDFLRRYAGEFGEDLALRTYTSRLISPPSSLL